MKQFGSQSLLEEEATPTNAYLGEQELFVFAQGWSPLNLGLKLNMPSFGVLEEKEGRITAP